MAITFVFSKDKEVLDISALHPEDSVRRISEKALEIEPAIASALAAVGLEDLSATIEICFSESPHPATITFYVIRAGLRPVEWGWDTLPVSPLNYQEFLAKNIFEALIHLGEFPNDRLQMVARAADIYFATEAKKLLMGATVIGIKPNGVLVLASGETSIEVSTRGLDWDGEGDVNTYLCITSSSPGSALILGGFESVIANDWPSNMLP